MFGSVLRADVLRNPFMMAFQDEHFTDYKMFYASNYTQLVEQTQNMQKDHCDLLLGLFVSQDCLIAGPLLKRNKKMGLSSSCSDDKIAKFYPYLYTAAPKSSGFSQQVADYVNHLQNAGTIYAFYHPANVYSQTEFDSFKQTIKKPFASIPIDSNANFNVKMLQGKQPFTLVFFTYPLPSVQILLNLKSHHLLTHTTTVVGDSSWIFDVSVLKPIKPILRQLKRVVTPSLVVQGKMSTSHFAHVFLQRYARDPDLVEVLTYDMTRLSVQCYQDTLRHGNYNNAAFSHCVEHNKYHGISGHLKFEKKSSFPNRDIHLIDFLTRVS